MRNIKKISLVGAVLLTLSILLYSTAPVFAAVGCTLNNPDRDIRVLFPESTSYKTHFETILENGGEPVAQEVEGKLGDKLDSDYETLDVPYAYYQVFKGHETIGYVFGVNQRGEYGTAQIILATDKSGKILNFYYQALRSPNKDSFTNTDFTFQFIGKTLADFYYHSAYKGTTKDPLGNITDPTGQNDPDFHNTIRGMKKNLILFDMFFLNRAYDAYLVQ